MQPTAHNFFKRFPVQETMSENTTTAIHRERVKKEILACVRHQSLYEEIYQSNGMSRTYQTAKIPDSEAQNTQKKDVYSSTLSGKTKVYDF
ncbi:MAG: hypothetical protein EZS28_034747 [Streblomastix strix]|uniref:Uncharacterized protein n=1 Tax=Streblomastix strix TaxID=222440 RepID=A0A5J4UG40_9EUKA|nr:MAG: hypothetical protein EZS28_034747 [Streblomastix strix]